MLINYFRFIKKLIARRRFQFMLFRNYPHSVKREWVEVRFLFRAILSCLYLEKVASKSFSFFIEGFCFAHTNTLVKEFSQAVRHSISICNLINTRANFKFYFIHFSFWQVRITCLASIWQISQDYRHLLNKEK
jgi:hypothetical protein